MKKGLFLIVLLVGLNLMFYRFFLVNSRAEKPQKGAPMVTPSGTSLWNYIKKEDYAKKWKMWPGKTAFYKAAEPHGALLTTYVNNLAFMAIAGKKGALPVGAIVAKENYSSDKKLMALTVMYKVKGYNPQAGDWFWAKYAPDGKIEAEGKVAMCIQCHSDTKNNDYIMTGSLSEIKESF